MSFLTLPMKRLSDVFFTTDIHGQYSLLKKSLKHAGFNPEKGHVLVSTGDLVDCGPENEAVLNLLSQDWFVSSMGNHDMMMLNATDDMSAHDFSRIQHFLHCENGLAKLHRCWRTREGSRADHAHVDNAMDRNQAHWVVNGGAWFFEPGKRWEKQREYRQLLADRSLPLAIELEFPEHRIGVVHAETARQDWGATRSFAEKGRSTPLLWSREHIKQCIEKTIDPQKRGWVHGIDAVVLGHTIMPEGRARLFGNSFYLDSGAKSGRWPTVLRANTLIHQLNTSD